MTPWMETRLLRKLQGGAIHSLSTCLQFKIKQAKLGNNWIHKQPTKGYMHFQLDTSLVANLEDLDVELRHGTA